MDEKRCFKCGKVKPLSEFYKHPQMSDGHLNKCKECAKADVSRYRSAHPDHELSTRLKTCEKNPTHKNAHMAVDAALRSGVISKPERCQGCGRNGSESRLGAHHYDYTRPLDVIWLCQVCHKRVDEVRAFVETGKSIDDWKHEKNARDGLTNRALRFYRANAKGRAK